MKKIFSKLILPIMALGIFAACDDVPSPYYVLSPEDAEYEIQGEGTSEDPYTVGDALTIINAGTYTSSSVFVEGIITQIDNIDTSYGNATYYIASESDINEDGSVNQQLEVYRGYYLNGDKFTSEDQMKVGDHVIVYGQITLYGSTPEVTQGSMLYEHNGKYSDNPESTTDPVGSGTWEDPYNVAAAKNVISTGTYTSDKVYVKGIVSKIDNIDTGYGNATYYISDDGTAAGQLEVYRGYSFGGARFTSQDELKVGDEVIVYGVLTLYGSTQEITQGSSIVYLNGQSDKPDEPGPAGDATGDGTLQNPYNSVAANQVCAAMAADEKTGEVFVKGKIVSISQNYDYNNKQFGNITCYISDNGQSTDQFCIWRALYFNNEKYTEGTLPKVGDEVIFYGKLTNYKGNTPETVQNEAYLYSLNGQTSGEGGGGDDPAPQPSEGEGSGTASSPYNVAAAQSVYNASGGAATSAYVKGFVVGYVNGNGLNENTATFGIPSAQETEILIADSPNETNFANCIPVQLPKGEIRDGLDIYTNQNILGQSVILYGSIEKYFGVAGLKNTSYGEWSGGTVGTKSVKRRRR